MYFHNTMKRQLAVGYMWVKLMLNVHKHYPGTSITVMSGSSTFLRNEPGRWQIKFLLIKAQKELIPTTDFVRTGFSDILKCRLCVVICFVSWCVV